MNQLKLENVHFQYNKDTPVLRGLNYTFETGKSYALMGYSGVGKSTLLALLGALMDPTEGVILFNNKPLPFYKNQYRLKYVSFIFQTYNLIEYMSVKENIELAYQIHFNHPLTNDLKVKEVLESVDLSEDYLNRSVKRLSEGEKQRVAIAKTLITSSSVILADEPTGNLDTDRSQIIVDNLKRLSQDRIVIVTTHQESVATQLDTILEMKDGHLIEK